MAYAVASHVENVRDGQGAISGNRSRGRGHEVYRSLAQVYIHSVMMVSFVLTLLLSLWRRFRKTLVRMGLVFPDEEVYLLNRSPKESARLNAQHDFLVNLIGGRPIHPAIPTEDITDVADIATGTGIWLMSLAAALNASPTNRLYLHGFDISATQYPFSKDISPSHELHLSVHDMRHRFLPEHRGRYDLIHLRLLVGALKEEDYARSMRNIYELLKPGGYLQWDDCDTTAFSTAESSPDPFIRRMQETVASAAVNLGLCPTAPLLIEKLATMVGFEDVTRQSYNTIDKPHLHDAARGWLVQVLRSLLPKSMLGTGEVTEESVAIERTERLVGELESHCQNVLPVVNLHVVVGRKPLS
ncbi:S-adenosyl-L-methionine-dependent methyltransferase [Aspergillus coremiiformis]|uniref:S-adenosyl-L-methionine-dependent methyltransferase n=1 Tax=Aspergillus coremiiformis TaxID=138285 RepID=A0A5N6ZA66_9EURO|nr:S-adenosyl-L-methionine-dependent methyltransferase [Aspergillus coremiiformis]